MSNEASLKYVLFGAVSTGAMLYGLSFLYGLAGTTSLPGIRAFLGAGLTRREPLRGLRHRAPGLRGLRLQDRRRCPSTSGAPTSTRARPTPVTAFLSVAPKAAGFAIMTRFFFQGHVDAGRRAVGPRGVARLAAVADADLGRDDDAGERRGAHPDQHEAAAGLLVDRPRRLHHDGRRGPLGERRAGAADLPARLRLHEPRRVPGRDADPQPGRHLRPARLPGHVPARAVPDPGHGGLPALAHGHPAARGLHGQALRLRGDHREGARRTVVRGGGRGERRDRRLLLRARAEDDDHRRGERRRGPPSRSPAVDMAWVLFFVAANVVPLLFWGAIDTWARHSVLLYAGR